MGRMSWSVVRPYRLALVDSVDRPYISITVFVCRRRCSLGRKLVSLCLVRRCCMGYGCMCVHAKQYENVRSCWSWKHVVNKKVAAPYCRAEKVRWPRRMRLLRWVTVSMPTGQTDWRTYARSLLYDFRCRGQDNKI